MIKFSEKVIIKNVDEATMESLKEILDELDSFHFFKHIFEKKMWKELASWNGTYLITFSANESDLFDIISIRDLFVFYRRKDDRKVLGIAGSKEDAIETVREMVEKIYNETKTFNVREYFG